VIVITVKYKTGFNASPEYVGDMDAQAKWDAERCLAALRKKYPGVLFRNDRTGQAQYDISALEASGWFREVNVFAEGFMASAHLWER